MSINRTIFPKFVDVPEVENATFGYSNTASLLSLSDVSKTARKKLDNAFFVARFWQEHPWLAESKEKRFVTLFENHPTLCGKILCGAFLKGRLKMSFPFFIEETPKICKLKQAEKQQCQSQNKEICGAYYKDPKSLIHQASEKKKAAEQQHKLICGDRAAAFKRLEATHSQEERENIIGLILLQPNHYFPNGEIAGWLMAGTDEEIAPLKKGFLSDYLSSFKLVLMGYALGLSQGMPTPPVMLNCPDFLELVKQVEKDEEYLIWKRHTTEAQNCVNNYNALEKKRKLCEEKIEKADKTLSFLNPVVSKPSHLNELTMMWFQLCRSPYSADLISRENDKKGNESDLKKYKKELNRMQKALSTGIVDKGYCERQIASLNNLIGGANTYSNVINASVNSVYSMVFNKEVEHFKQNYIQFFIRHQTALKGEFEAELVRDKAGVQASILAKCLPLIQSAIEIQNAGKKPSSSLLDQIRSSICSLEGEHQKTIWGGLYDRCAKKVNELGWSKRHFPKFLGELNNLATIVFNDLSAASKKVK